MAAIRIVSKVTFLALLIVQPSAALRDVKSMQQEVQEGGAPASSGPTGFEPPDSSVLLERLQSRQGELEEQIKKAVAEIKSHSHNFEKQASNDIKFLDQKEEEKISVKIMTAAEYQQWERRERRHTAYSWGEAKEFLQRRFQDVKNSSHEEVMSSLVELEQGANTSQQAAFWRRHRERMEAEAKGMLGKPKVMAHLCIQVDVNLAFISLPFIYLNLGVMGSLAYDTKSSCWAWALEVGIGLSGGIPIGSSLRLGIGVSLVGAWSLHETPFSYTGLKASDYVLPTQCSAEAHRQLTGDGVSMCHTKNPFMLIWVALRSTMAKAANSIFPAKNAKEIIDEEMALFAEGAKKELKVQTRNWEEYKNTMLKQGPGWGELIGTNLMHVKCLKVTYETQPTYKVSFKPVAGAGLAGIGIRRVVDGIVSGVIPESQAHLAGVLSDDTVVQVNGAAFGFEKLRGVAYGDQPFEVVFKRSQKLNPLMYSGEPAKRLRCGLQAGTFKQSRSQRGMQVGGGQSKGLRVYHYVHPEDFRRTSIGGQVLLNLGPGSTAASNLQHRNVKWNESSAPSTNMLMDTGRNSHLRVLMWNAASPNIERVEGIVKVDSNTIEMSGKRQTLEVPVGCMVGKDGIERGCLGKATVAIEPAKRRGRLSLKCMRVKRLARKWIEEVVDADKQQIHCGFGLRTSSVLGRNRVWRTTGVRVSRSPQWDEGTSFGIYSPVESGDIAPPDGLSAQALQVNVWIPEESGRPEAVWGRSVTTDLFSDVAGLARAGRPKGILTTRTSFTWEELLGKRGFLRPADTEARNLYKPLGPDGDEVQIQVAWEPEPKEGVSWEEMSVQAGSDLTRLVRAASGMFTASEQLVAKFPKYAEQVLERLMDNPDTDLVTNGDAGVDCAVEYSKGTFSGSGTCPLLLTNGRFGARMQRQLTEEEKTQGTVYKKGHKAYDWIPDDRVMNLAKAARVSERRADKGFYSDLGRSAANVFIRTIQDVQALFNIYFADEAEWDGDCNDLKPAFELPGEFGGNKAKGHPMTRRYRALNYSKVNERRFANINGARLFKGAQIMEPNEASYSQATYNAWADHRFVFGHGYDPKDESKAYHGRIKFLTPDPPQKGKLGGFHFEGPSGPTVVTHLWCELSEALAKKALATSQQNADPKAKAERRKKSNARRAELGKSFIFRNKPAPKMDEGLGYSEMVVEAMTALDEDKDGVLKIEELTVSFDEACVDTDCGERSDCEKVRLKPAFVALFPSLTLTIEKYRHLLEARLTKLRELNEQQGLTIADAVKQERKLTFQIIELVRRWLQELGACKAGVGSGAERNNMCAVLKEKTGVILSKQREDEFRAIRGASQRAVTELDTELAKKESCPFEGICYKDFDLLDTIYMDLHQAFAVKTRLPISLQGTAYAAEGTAMRGVLWDHLQDARQELIKDATSDSHDKDTTVLGMMEKKVEERMKKLAHRFNPEAQWRLQFPLIETSFTLSLTAETATPGFCTPNGALLWFTWSVHGVTRSWDREFEDVTRCFTAKVHPHNFLVRMTSCGVLEHGLAKDAMGKAVEVWFPSYNGKDRDISVTVQTNLLSFNPGDGFNSVFTSVDPKQKVLSSNFLAPASEAVATLPVGAMAGTGAVIGALAASPLIDMATVLTTGDPTLNDMMESGTAGMVNGLRRVYKKLRGLAKKDPKKPGAAEMASENNGDDWVDSEDPDRKPGNSFGVAEDDEVPRFAEDTDSRHYRKHNTCNSICGGHSVEITGGARGQEKTIKKLHEQLRPDQCAYCSWKETECGEWEVLDSESPIYGKLCCMRRPCDALPVIPGDNLSVCLAVDRNETQQELQVSSPEVVLEGAAPMPDEPPCCNTACGARGFEPIDGPAFSVGMFVRFANESFLGWNECGQCRWTASSCNKEEGWHDQAIKGFRRVCCKKHTCSAKPSGIDVAVATSSSNGEPNTIVSTAGADKVSTPDSKGSTGKFVWQRHPGCAAFGVDRPRFWTNSKLNEKIGGTECGASGFTTEDGSEYPFLNKKFLHDAQGHPSMCAQCIWKPKDIKCSTAQVRLEDGAVAENLVKQVRGRWHRYHLCCTKLDCTAKVADDSDSKSSKESWLQVNSTAQATSKAVTPSLLQQDAQDSQEGNPKVKWVLHVTGTRHIRHFEGTFGVPTHIKDATRIKRTWWTWEAHLEGWHWVEFPPVPLGIAFASPVVALNLDWDLSETVSTKINDFLNISHQKRVNTCLQCVANKQAYCNRKYEDPHYNKKKHEICYAPNTNNSLACTQLVTYDDHGNPTSPRFIVEEEECRMMPFRQVNEGYRRNYGAVSSFRNFRGVAHHVKAPLDKWGNSMELKVGDENKEEEEEEEDKHEDTGFGAAASQPLDL